MSIKDDFIYLNTTKKLLKNEINKVKNVIDDNSTFRSYPQELFNGYLDILNNGTDTLWSNLEKVSQIGTEAVLENVENAPMKIELSGNTSQDTTEGYNLFNPTEEWPDNYGVVSTFDGQNIIWNGTSSRNATKKVGNINMPVDTYTIVFEPISGTHIDSKHIWIDLMNGSTKVGGVNFTFKGSKVVTLSETADNIKLGFDASDTFDNYKFRILIHSGLEEKPYEPYTNGASPNPDYPQEVKVVKGENVVSVSGKNLFDKSSNIVLNKYIGEDGAISGNSPRNWYQEDYIEVSNSTDYIISTTSSNYVRVAFYDDSKNFIARIVANGGIQISTTSSTKYLRLSGYDNLNDNIQLELGSTATPYVPYSKTDYPINLGDIELCKINTYKDYFYKDSGKWYVHKEIGKVVLDGSESWSSPNKNQFNVNKDITTKINTEISNIYCNAFKGTPAFNTDSNFYNYVINNELNNMICLHTNSHGIRTYATKYSTVQEFKDWLASNNVTLYYVLATPTETEITNTTLIEQLEAISKAKSVKEKTYVTQTNDELPFVLDVEAIKKYEVA